MEKNGKILQKHFLPLFRLCRQQQILCTRGDTILIGGWIIWKVYRHYKENRPK